MVRGVIFDLDGTILDTVGDICAALNKTLGSSFSVEQCNMFVGNGLKNAIIKALQALNRTSEDVDALFKTLVEYYKQDPVRYTVAYPGVHNFLLSLNAQGIAVGVFSNKEQELTETVVHLSFPDVKFDFICGRHGKYPAKPAPEAVLGFASLIGASSDEIFYIGDSEVDYNCACSANVKKAILTWGTRTAEYLISNGLDKNVLVKDMNEAASLAGIKISND